MSDLQGFEIVTMAEQPELLEELEPTIEGAFPEFLNHDKVWFDCWPDLLKHWPELHVFVTERGASSPLAMISAVPIAWDGVRANLPAGTHSSMEQALTERVEGINQNAACAIQAVIVPEHLGRGLGGAVMQAFIENARRLGYEYVFSPIRPTAKQEYPTIPLQRYATWTRPDGELLDPWLRLQARCGGTMLDVCDDSLVMENSVSDWEEWTGLAFPESGDYVIPGGQELLQIDRENDVGRYAESHVWYQYDA